MNSNTGINIVIQKTNIFLFNNFDDNCVQWREEKKSNYLNSRLKSYFHAIKNIAIKIIKNAVILKNIHRMLQILAMFMQPQ